MASAGNRTPSENVTAGPQRLPQGERAVDPAVMSCFRFRSL